MTLALGVAAHAAEAPATGQYVLDPAKSSLEFSFTQAGAQNKGKFTRFPVSFTFSPDAPGTGPPRGHDRDGIAGYRRQGA